jgi:hypothetical protein
MEVVKWIRLEHSFNYSRFICHVWQFATIGTTNGGYGTIRFHGL